MRGFIKFFDAGIIKTLPKIIGVQSAHANPVCRYYREPDPAKRRFKPITVKASVAQAAMIGNPVSMPRVIQLVETYNRRADASRICFIEVSEQEIMDWALRANRNGHIVCTHGGECLAGLVQAGKRGLVANDETAIVDATAHALKFGGFQEMYFENRFPEEFQIQPRSALINTPVLVKPQGLEHFPEPGKPLTGAAFQKFVEQVSREIAAILELSER
jgi:threonine synthase